MQSLLDALPGPLPFKLFLLLLPMAFNLWGILHLWRRESMEQSVRLLWLCVCVFLPVAGGLAYFFRTWLLRRAKRPKIKMQDF